MIVCLFLRINATICVAFFLYPRRVCHDRFFPETPVGFVLLFRGGGGGDAAFVASRHPGAVRLVSLACALYGEKAKSVLSTLLFACLIALFVTITNALFAKEGETVILAIGKVAITIEEVWYGITLSVSLIAVFNWFRLLNKTLTDDKFIYLFGGILPRTAATLALSLKSITLFRKKADSIREALIGLEGRAGKGLKARFSRAVRVFTGLFAWSFENVIATADAMRARGYGLKPRTRYARYRFRVTDGVLLGFSIVIVAIVAGGVLSGMLTFSYYPRPGGLSRDWMTVTANGACGLFFACPLLL